MKKMLAMFMVVAMMMCAMSSVLAEAPSAGSLNVVMQKIRGNEAWTKESYPEVWITPGYAEYIITQKDPEKYPANFIRFAPPEGCMPMSFDVDEAEFVNFDTLVSYSYQAVDRASYELFLEKADKENILLDGADGVAMYIIPDNRRAASMISTPDFGETSKLIIWLYDHTGDLKADELTKLIQDETKRVQEAMQIEKLDKFWSQGVFNDVEVFDDYYDVSIHVNAKDLTLTRLNPDQLYSTVSVDGEAEEVEISVSTFTYEDDCTEATLADGTPYSLHTMDYFSFAFFPVKTVDQYTVGVVIKITSAPEDFAAKLETVYPLITFPKPE